MVKFYISEGKCLVFSFTKSKSSKTEDEEDYFSSKYLHKWSFPLTEIETSYNIFWPKG